MAKFVLLYKGAAPDMASMSPEDIQAEMGRWHDWMARVGAALVDGGLPFGASASVVDDGSEGKPAPMTGYTIVEAERPGRGEGAVRRPPVPRRRQGLLRRRRLRVPGDARRLSYSHSMVPGGLLVTSSTTRLTSRTSLVMRVEILASTSYGHARPVGGHRVLGRHRAQHDRVAVGAAVALHADRPDVGEQHDGALPDVAVQAGLAAAPRGRSRRPRAAGRAGRG